MKVIAFNGSPKESGNTYHGLKLVSEELNSQDIETEIVHVGSETISGCIACGYCAREQNEKCVITKDSVNEWIQKIKQADGVLLGSPVHYAAIGGTMKSFLDRAFMVAGANGGLFRHKAGASVVAVRRSGGVTTFDQLNNYILYSEMIMPGSNYWNVIHGGKPSEALQDDEGVQIMKLLGKNMAWLLKLMENGKGSVNVPEKENKIFMNFIR